MGKGFLRNIKLFALLVVVAPFMLACASVMEAAQAYDEKPSVEMVLDRVNTAARVLDLEGIMLRTMPISAASKWPKAADSSIPAGDQSKLLGIVATDAIFAPGSGFRPSAIRLKVQYMQTIFFEKFPSLYYERQYAEKTIPSATVIEAGKKALGAAYNDKIHHKTFYQFLKFSPDFSPKANLFDAKLGGAPVDFYPTIMDAVISLSKNPAELKDVRAKIDELAEQKQVPVRDIAEAAKKIKTLKDAGETKNQAEINKLKGDIKISKAEYDKLAVSAEAELKKWTQLLAAMKNETGELTAEQKALAINIQSAVSAVKGLHTDATTLVTIALLKLPTSVMGLPDEVGRLATAPYGVIRVARIYLNLSSLADNASIIKNELGQMYTEANAMDGLFEKRLKVTEVDKKGGK